MSSSEPIQHTVDHPAPVQLDRALGPWMATAVVVGNVIGSGIFKKPGTIAADSGNLPLILGVWCLAGGLCLIGRTLDRGIVRYAASRWRDFTSTFAKPTVDSLRSFMAGPNWCWPRPASMGALAVAFVDSFSLSIGWSPSELFQAAWRAL